MTGNPTTITRRHFSQLLAASVASTLFGQNTFASTPAPKGFVYVASAEESGTIHIFQISGSRWRKTQSILSANPTHLEPHPTLPILYAVHNVPLWNHLPRGAVSAYAIDPHGHLNHLNTQPLSLSATHPRHAAVTPDGQSLFVASEQAGIYNLLPVAGDGTLLALSAIRKELNLASPRHILAHSDGTIFTADSIQQTINSFTLAEGSIQLRHRRKTPPGTGSSRLALHPSGNHLYALNAANGSIAVHRLEDGNVEPSQTYTPFNPGRSTMAMHPEGRFLLTSRSNKLAVLAIDSKGHLAPHRSFRLRDSFHTLGLLNDGKNIIASQTSSGRILLIPFNTESGALGSPQTVAQITHPSSILFRPA